MSTYAIGDIHGCKEELVALIRKLRDQGLEHEDTLVFLGDYVDRGPDSKGVVDTLLLLASYQKCVFLRGNHEDMMLDHLEISPGPAEYRGAWVNFRVNGASATINSYGGRPEFPGLFSAEHLPQDHLNFFQNLVYSYIEGPVLFVHAGIHRDAYGAATPEQAVIMSSLDDSLTWVRPNYEKPNNFGTIVHGHTPQKSGTVWWHEREDGGAPYRVNVDTGCVYGCGPLTAIRIDDWKVIHC